jgi:hypothetical protein
MSAASLRLKATVCLTAVVTVGFPQSVRASSSYYQMNLTSDVPGLASNTDPNLKNPWGMSFSATSPFWVSDQATSVSTLYTGTGSSVPLVMTIPPTSPPARRAYLPSI